MGAKGLSAFDRLLVIASSESRDAVGLLLPELVPTSLFRALRRIDAAA